ncbi:MAG: VCBS repeat-containing protein, partial [Thermoplasmata archaeon]|nr:VCBS repeat-containing protein [Thermoplasmata archaeon]
RRSRWQALLAVIMLLVTLLPSSMAADPWDDTQLPQAVDGKEARSSSPTYRSDPPWPEPGVGIPGHYADWALISSPLEYQTRGWHIFPLTMDNGSLEVLAVEDSSRAYRYVQEGQVLRQTRYSPLDVSAWTWNAMMAREAGGRDVLLVETHEVEVHSYWADDLTYRSTLHRSSRILGTGDWDGDGYEDVWLWTTTGLVMVLNLTSGHLAATSKALHTYYIRNCAVADVDGDGCDELVILESDGLAVYDGPVLERDVVASFPHDYQVNRIKAVPREGKLPLIVGFTYYSVGVAWLDLETGNSSMMDTDIDDVLDVVYPQGPDAAGTPRIYLTRESEVVRRVHLLTNNTTTHDLGGSDWLGRLVLVGEPGNASSVLVLNRNTDLKLLATDDLRTLASTVPGPYEGRLLAQGGDLRAKGLDGDALVFNRGIHLMDMEEGMVETLVERVYNARAALWSRGPGGRDSLFVLTDSGSESDLLRFHVDNGTLVLDRTTTFIGTAGWMGLFISPSGTEWLLLVTGSNLQAIDPIEPSLAGVAVDTFRVPALGDVDGDGVPELLYYDGDASVRCLNITNRSLEWSLNVTAPVETMLVGEVDGDPDPEIVISYTGGHLEVLDGPTRQIEVSTNGSLDNVTSMTVGDVDVDG